MELTDRKRRILRAVVEHYIETAEPIGSKAVAQRAGLTCSSATIRNEMADLEKLGYLEQPHTSAGRIPSSLGYRLYVNELMEEHKLSLQETQRINDALHVKMQELDRIIDQAGKMVSQLTNYPAFALAGRRQKPTVSRFDLLQVDANSFIIVLMTNGNQVKNKLIRLTSEVSAPQLQLLSTLLNASFTGKPLDDFPAALEQMAQSAAGSSYALIHLVVSYAMEILEELERSSIHTAGVTKLLEHSEYQNVDKAHELLGFLEEESDLAQLPSAMGDSSTKILIGPENIAQELKDTSVVMASYDIGDGMRGVIGVVGPTRMDYAKVTARLSYFAESLSKMFGKDDPALDRHELPKALNPFSGESESPDEKK